jgi:hypothetical protein
LNQAHQNQTLKLVHTKWDEGKSRSPLAFSNGGLHADLVFSLKWIKISHNSILFAGLCLKVVDISKTHLGLYGDFDLGRV